MAVVCALYLLLLRATGALKNLAQNKPQKRTSMATIDSLQQLPGFSPARLDALSPGDRQRLLDTLRTARRVQDQDYQTAIDKALSHVPALLRGSFRKIIMG
jgi:hypothetical protein